MLGKLPLNKYDYKYFNPGFPLTTSTYQDLDPEIRGWCVYAYFMENYVDLIVGRSFISMPNINNAFYYLISVRETMYSLVNSKNELIMEFYVSIVKNSVYFKRYYNSKLVVKTILRSNRNSLKKIIILDQNKKILSEFDKVMLFIQVHIYFFVFVLFYIDTWQSDITDLIRKSINDRSYAKGLDLRSVFGTTLNRSDFLGKSCKKDNKEAIKAFLNNRNKKYAICKTN